MLSSSPAIINQAPTPTAPVQWHNHVLRKKYRDPLKLKQALTAMYGEGNYRIKVRADRWIVAIPREMSNVRSNCEPTGWNDAVFEVLLLIKHGLRVQIEMDELESSVYSHY